jgi:hypothetical protein
VGPLLVLKAKRRLKAPSQGCAHGLSGELIVSLTSYPDRFATLHLTLACLLDQSVKADRIVLWIAHQDMGKLPKSVTGLESRGLEVRSCDDLRSYKKLIPALQAFPDAFVATADDDIYYRADWLEALVNGVEDRVIACHRVHRIRRLRDGSFAPYDRWERDVQDGSARRPSKDVLATSGAGALYPPRSLAPIVTDQSKFTAICGDGDDLWLHWCARMAGTLHKKVGSKMLLTPWPNSQPSALWDVNEQGGNDRMIASLQAEFGYPE